MTAQLPNTEYTLEDLHEIAYRGSYDDMQRDLARALLAAYEQEPVVNDAMALAFHHAITDESASRDDLDEIKTGLRAALANYPRPAPSIPVPPVAQPVMFIDGDISSEDAEKLAKVIREFNEEDERPLAKMARIIRENPHPTNECDMLKNKPAPSIPALPDKMLCDFYEVSNWTDLVRELVKHVEQLQDSAKRNVKPWEDTFPATLLPAYIDRIKQADDACRAAMLQGAEPDFREISNSSTNNCRENAEMSTKCWCLTCRPVTISDMRFVVCPECGNKRCPHANDHRNACTGSNEPGQEGSAYPAAPQQEVK